MILSHVRIVNFVLQTAFVYTDPSEPYREPGDEGVAVSVLSSQQRRPASKMLASLTA